MLFSSVQFWHSLGEGSGGGYLALLDVFTLCVDTLIAIKKQDFKERVKAYEAVYEAIEDNEDGGDIQYIKLYNVGQKVVTRNCKGYLPSQVAFYLQARQPQSASVIYLFFPYFSFAFFFFFFLRDRVLLGAGR